jgi:tetraacyldisaccharide 4'-kinase
MKAPLFWYRPRGVLSTLFWPLGWAYGKGGKILRTLKNQKRCPVPILSVGNIVCGGSGKTPTAIALAHLLQKRGISVHFVTRGYGGIQRGPLKVDPTSHTSTDVGDEPLLLAEHAPTWVAKDRPQGVQRAIKSGARLIILDDGHQTNSLYKDLSFVVVDLLQGFGNENVIPAGPLRESLAEGLKRSDALIGIGGGGMLTPQPFFKARSIPHPLTLPSNRVVAFCGLGFPQKFYKALKDLNINLVDTISFPDHYNYTEEDLIHLYKLAKDHQAVLVTTRKDRVKIPPSWQDLLHVLDISIQFEDPEGICDFILQKIPALRRDFEG